MKSLLQIAFFTVTICTPATLSAQDDSGSDKSEQTARLPYEVIITPTIRRGDIRKLIVQVEDDFFAKYNELNLDDDYDVACYQEKITMSHITTRVCEPWFMIKARGEASAEMAYSLGSKFGSASSPPVGAQSAPMIYTVREIRQKMDPEYETLQIKMEEFTRGNLEFRSIGNALAELKSRLENFGED